MKTTNVTADLTAGIDFSFMVQTLTYVRSDAALYASQIMGDCREFLNTCWARLNRLKKLTSYRIRRFNQLRREYIKSLNRYYLRLSEYYSLALNGVELSRADYERVMIQKKLNRLAA